MTTDSIPENPTHFSMRSWLQLARKAATFTKLAHKSGACELLAGFVECGELLGFGGFAFWVV